jgi:Protein of unknown function (DUF2917)
MIRKGYDDVMELADGELVELQDVRGTTLRVTHGTVWITQDRDIRDVVLRTGDVWTIERDGLTLAEAQGAATFCLVGGRSRRVSARGLRPTYGQRVAAWFVSLAHTRPVRRYIPYV